MVRSAWWAAALPLLAALGIALSGCDAISSLDATDVPGAAATQARSSRTAIPTPVESPRPALPSGVPSPSPAPVPSAIVAVRASPSASLGPLGSNLPDPDGSQAHAALQAALASPQLPGIESLLLDSVSLSTPDGGQVLSRADAATWLRGHAGPGIQVTDFAGSNVAAVIQATATGWRTDPPLAAGTVTFDFHRYNAAGQADEQGGAWKIDVIAGE